MRVHEITAVRGFSSEELKRISTEAGRFYSDIHLTIGETTLDVKSLLGMLMFRIHQGSVVLIRTKGKDEEEALDFMCGYLES